MSFAFDHLVVVVSDLARGIVTFESAGFTVISGGRHDAPPTHNALIPFEQGGYIELLAFRGSREAAAAREAWSAGSATGVERRFLSRLLRGEGMADVALHGADLRGLAAASDGVRWSERLPMSRRRPDGVKLEWDLAFPDRDDLPFVMVDRTPRSLRIPSDPDELMHPNGALGIARVMLRSPHPAESARAWTETFGAEPASEGTTIPTVRLASVRFAFAASESAGVSSATIQGIGAVGEAVRALGIDAALR
jgi:hypothetical protein